MSTLKALQNRVRGWFPQEPNLLSLPTKETKISPPTRTKLPKGGLLLFSLFTILSVSYFVEGNILGAPFLWLSSILGVSCAFDILVAQDKELNTKLTMAILLSAISAGGILVNLYVFSVPSSVLIRAFSLVALALVHVPFLFAVVAYVLGKKELSKKAIGWFSTRRS